MLALLLCSVAYAARVGVADVDAMIASVKPELESVMGLVLEDVPKAHVSTREALVVRTGAVYAGRIRAYRELAEGEGAKIRARAARDVDRALALYLPDDGDIYLNSDAVQKAFADAEASGALLQPVVRCVIAHELTHALQDQVAAVPWEDDDDLLERSEFLREGQAMQIELQLCKDERAQNFLEALTNVDVLARRACPSWRTRPVSSTRW